MRIAIANDMGLAVEVLRRVIVSTAEHQVAWVARDGREAVENCRKDRPDLILMDLVMPGLDGVGATREIMKSNPCAILIVTASVNQRAGKVFEALGAGALDAIKTPHIGPQMDSAGLLSKISTIGRLLAHPDPVNGRSRQPAGETGKGRLPMLAIGASSGGPKALVRILSELPSDLPATVAIVQHIDPEFTSGLVSWLREHCALPVVTAVEGQTPRRAEVSVAATGDHLRMSRSGRFRYTDDPLNLVHRPSVDIFFQSLAAHWNGPVIGVILTGMGADGANGLLALRQAGHHTIVQDRATSAIYGMPKAAAEIGAAVEIHPIESIAATVLARLQRGESLRVNR